MSEAIPDVEACAILDVDPFALERFVRTGELEARILEGRRMFDRAAVEAFAAQLSKRRREALEALATLDAPHV